MKELGNGYSFIDSEYKIKLKEWENMNREKLGEKIKYHSFSN